MKRFLAVLVLLFPLSVLAQNARYDALVSSASPPASVQVCSSPANGVPCTNFATTYTASGQACSNNAQDTPQSQQNVCQATVDQRGAIGFWAPAGTYDYTFCSAGNCSGPFTVTIGGGSGAGNLSGTLTPGTIPRATGAHTLGDGSLTDDGSGNIDFIGVGSWNGAFGQRILFPATGNIRWQTDVSEISAISAANMGPPCTTLAATTGCIYVTTANTPIVFSHGLLASHTGGALWQGEASGAVGVYAQDVAGLTYLTWPAPVGGVGVIPSTATPPLFINSTTGDITCTTCGNLSTSGTPLAGQVGFFADTTHLQGLTGFTFDPATGNLTIPGTFTAGASGVAGTTIWKYGTAPAVVAGGITEHAATSGTDYELIKPSAPATGLKHWTNVAGVVTETVSAVALTDLATQAADTTLLNATGGAAKPTAVAMPTTGTNGCAGTTDTLIYNTTTHVLGCHQIAGGGGGASAIWTMTTTNKAAPTGTVFWAPNGVGTAANNSNVTEATIQTVMASAGTMTALYARVSDTETGGATLAITARKNSSAQTITCTISATTCNDTGHSFSWVAGDTIGYQVVQTGTGTSQQFSISALYTIP